MAALVDRLFGMLTCGPLGKSGALEDEEPEADAVLSLSVAAAERPLIEVVPQPLATDNNLVLPQLPLSGSEAVAEAVVNDGTAAVMPAAKAEVGLEAELKEASEAGKGKMEVVECLRIVCVDCGKPTRHASLWQPSGC